MHTFKRLNTPSGKKKHGQNNRKLYKCISCGSIKIVDNYSVNYYMQMTRNEQDQATYNETTRVEPQCIPDKQSQEEARKQGVVNNHREW